ncbi:DUF2075 domain-containing protein [Lampropedia aestuarii]|uniref:DUF2075 domain-containing protein n=1 Tax=Lampropedia aestuarii TaxID=2562762 RepID=A0A4S5BJY0_9BURK|nr:DEAD/DEAH box helicase family protein [Lampropedia aestuarii]THJ30961.1 DUF2075 domain-containing protein [Lampropedia aestuarii]
MTSLFASAMPNYDKADFGTPRPFQTPTIEAIAEGFRQGHRRQLIMAPTGAGKSWIGHKIAHSALVNNKPKQKRVMFICDRETLVEQTSQAADGYGLSDHAIIKAKHWRRDRDIPYQIASMQTLTRRDKWPEADLVIIDEAHTIYEKCFDYYLKSEEGSKAFVIGLTATPFVAGLGSFYTNLVKAATMDELTRDGTLVPLRVLSCKPINMDGIAKKGGEWTAEDVGERGMEIVGDVVAEWHKHGENRKTIVFAATIDHCKELARQFIESGVVAATYTSKTPDEEKASLLKEFKKAESSIRVLISVEALAKGFDVRDVGCVVDCRPLRKSLSLAIQMWGRGLRSSPETGKTDCILLDHSGNIVRFLADYEDFFYNGVHSLVEGERLDKTPRKEPEFREPKGCPSCGFKPFGKHCMACGYEYVAPALDAAISGEMKEVVIGKQKLADDKKHLFDQLVAYSKTKPKLVKKEGFVKAKFKEWTGDWPSWDFCRASDVPITRAVSGRIAHESIRFNKRASA